MSTLNRFLRRAALASLPVVVACASAATAVPAAAADGPGAAPAQSQSGLPDQGPMSDQQLCAANAQSQLFGFGNYGPFGAMGPWGAMGPLNGKPRPECRGGLFGSLLGGGTSPFGAGFPFGGGGSSPFGGGFPFGGGGFPF